MRPSALPRMGSAAAIIIIIPARSVGVADAQVVEDTPACRSTGRRCRDRCEIAPSRRRTGIVAALPGVGKEVIAAAVAVVCSSLSTYLSADVHTDIVRTEIENMMPSASPSCETCISFRVHAQGHIQKA